MLISYKLGQASVVLRVKLRSTTAPYAGATGLTSSSSGLRIAVIADNEATTTAYTSAATNVETIATLGIYAAPTAGKCRFREVDATSHPGLYEIQIADARFNVSSAKSVTVSITGLSGVFECDALIPLLSFNPYNGANLDLTCLPGVSPNNAGGFLTVGTSSGQLTPSLGRVNIANGGLTSSTVAQSFLDVVADAVADWALTNGAAGGPWEALANLVARITSGRAAALDFLDASVASRAAASVWTNALATLIATNLDGTITSRAAAADWTTALATKINTNLDAAITSRAAASAWTSSLANQIATNLDATITSTASASGQAAIAATLGGVNSTVNTISGVVSTSGVVVADASKAGYSLTSAERNSIANTVLGYNFANVTGAASRSLLNAARFLRNRWFKGAGNAITVCTEDDATTAWTGVYSTDASGTPGVSGIDPS